MDVPKPGVPDADTVQNGGQAIIDYLLTRGTTWWTLVIIGVIALVAMFALRNPLIKGAVIAAAVLFCVALSFGMFK